MKIIKKVLKIIVLLLVTLILGVFIFLYVNSLETTPEFKALYADNWELSQARALSVVRYMTQVLRFPPNRLAATGFGEYQPVNPANTPQARAQNRRIELKLTER